MENEGEIITVLGPIDPADVGITLMHEHMLFAGFWLFDCSRFIDGEDAAHPFAESFDVGTYGPVTRENAVWLRHHPYVNRENLVNTDWRLAATELRRFKFGGREDDRRCVTEGQARRVGAPQDRRGCGHQCRRRKRVLRRASTPLGHG